MKKNAMLKIAAILMVAVLLTTCAISSTFAKYTTGDSKNATARVAKWGVDATLAMNGIFGTTYSSAVGSVTSSNGDNVIAPGTYDEIVVTSEVTGTPEVSVDITYTATLTLSGFDTYFPLRFYINDELVTGTDGVTPGTVADVIAAVEAAFENQSAVAVAPNTDLASLTNDVKISWEWLFDNGNDVKDTALGDTAANATAASVTLDVAVTVDQTGPAAVKPVANP